MADKYINQTGLQTIKTWIEGKFGTKTEVTAVDTKVNNLSDRVDEIVAEGGEPNTIETVKVNGTALVPDAQKAVDVKVPYIAENGSGGVTIEDTNGGSALSLSIIQNGASVSSYGQDTELASIDYVNTADANKASLAKSSNPAGATGEETTYTISQGSDSVSFNYTEDAGTLSNYVNVNLGNDLFQVATTNYVDANGGKIDKIKVNGIAQPITNKEVDIEVPTLLVGDGLAKVSNQSDNSFEFSAIQAGLEYTSKINNVTDTNVILASKNYVDTNFRTEAQVQSAIDASLADITGIDFKIVTELPATGVKGTIYLLEDGAHAGTYVEYIWIDGDPTGSFEKIGTTEADLTDYWTSVDGKTNSLVAMTVAEITAILEPTNP